MPNKVFSRRITVTIHHTNMQGNVYWTNYLIWLGDVRELLLLELLGLKPGESPLPFLAQKGISLETCDVSMKLIRPAFFGDVLEVRLQLADFTKKTVKIIVSIVKVEPDKEQEIAKGEQRLAFVEMASQQLTDFPDWLKEPARAYEINP